MREFGTPVGPETRMEILKLARSIFDRAQSKREVRASEFAMEEDPDRVVVDEVDLRHEHERLRIAETKSEARPPFEWLLEITSDIGEADYFKHYLIRDDDVVLAQRKVLTPLDAVEAELVLADLRTAEGWLEAGA
jgi:hypothetical protein